MAHRGSLSRATPRIPTEEYEANARDISPNYFETMGIPRAQGRAFNEHDDAKAPHVVIINQTLAGLVFPGQDPIGKRIDFTYTKDPNIYEVVGVVGDENLGQLDQQAHAGDLRAVRAKSDMMLSVTIRTEGDPSAAAGSVREAMHELDASLPVNSLVSMDRIIADSPSVAIRRYPAYLLGAFASLALLLAMLGIYGLLAYVVAQRTRELGIRLALGAQRRNLLGLVIASGLRLALLGAAIGAVCALATGRMLATLLFDVRSTDVAILLSVATLLVVVALLASYIPARRAASIEPMQALRAE